MNIHECAASGDLVGLKRATRKAKHLNAVNSDGKTPLMVAVASERAGIEIVQWLIECGADVNAVSVPKPVIQMDPEMTALLEETGQDTSFIEEANKIPRTESALTSAAQYATLAKIKLLVDSGADVTWKDASGYSALLKALFRQVETTDAEQQDILELLIAAGAPLNDVSSHGESLLSVSSRTADLQLLKFFLDHGADRSELQWNDLCRAVALGTLDELARLLHDPSGLEHTDLWGRTPFLLAVHCGRLDMAQLLLGKGSHGAATGRCGTTAMGYAIEGSHVDLVRWLIAAGWDVDAPTDEFGAIPLAGALCCDDLECVKALIAAGANVHQKTAYDESLMEYASTTESIKILAASGLEISDLPSGQRPVLFGLNSTRPFAASKADYKRHRQPRFGKANPEQANNGFWDEMVRTRISAWEASQNFGEGNSFKHRPVWCCTRYGQSLTALPSGEYVEIGGEHEDHYDADFKIYNDVVVHDGRGHFRIYIYPQAVFPSTDFHSATLCNDDIYIIGNLGYPDDRRPGQTPVFRLNCQTFSIQQIPSTGRQPGWIHKHTAMLEDSGLIRVSGGSIWTGEDFAENSDEFFYQPETQCWI